MDGDDDEDDDNDEDDGDLVLQLFTLPPYNKNLQSAYLGPLRLVHRNPCVPDSLHALPRDDGDVHGRKKNGKAANSIYKSGTGANTIL
jgi:hypothetical protein